MLSTLITSSNFIFIKQTPPDQQNSYNECNMVNFSQNRWTQNLTEFKRNKRNQRI